MVRRWALWKTVSRFPRSGGRALRVHGSGSVHGLSRLHPRPGAAVFGELALLLVVLHPVVPRVIGRDVRPQAPGEGGSSGEMELFGASQVGIAGQDKGQEILKFTRGDSRRASR